MQFIATKRFSPKIYRQAMILIIKDACLETFARCREREEEERERESTAAASQEFPKFYIVFMLL